MTKINKLAEHIMEELCGAKEYAEKYIEEKVEGDNSWASKYREMANDELKHAMYLHEKAVCTIDKISKLYEPPVEMQERWEKCHREYVERAAWVKQMLSL